jgi:hypothetical protein
MRRAHRYVILTAAAAAVAVPAAGDTAVTTLDAIAEFGQRPPGTPSGVTYSTIQTPMTDGTGVYLFESQLTGASLGPGFQDAGVFLGRRGALQLVARVSGVAPGTGGLQWSKLLGVGQILRPGGRIAFPGELAGADAEHKGGIWTGKSVADLVLLVREGDPAPGTTVNFAAGNRYFQAGLHLAMNDAGTFALRAQLAGVGVTTANDQALFAGTPGALALVGRLGSPAPDAGGATFAKTFESFTSPSINASGQILFRGHLAGTGVTATNADAIWFGAPAAPAIAFRSGDPVSGPGIPQGAYLAGLGSEPPVLNDAGQILFEAPYFDGANLVLCLWLGPPHAPVAIAKAGQPVPGDSHGSSLGGLILHPRLNGTGQAAFHQTLSSGASDFALLMWDGAALHEVWRKGDQAPGMPVGESFDGVATGDVFLNAQGKILFRATTTPSSIQGVWLWDPASGTSQLLARTGVNATIGTASKLLIDTLLLNASDSAGSPQDGRSSPLGDDGTYAFWGVTVDGHSYVLTNAAGAASVGGATPSSVSVGTTIDVKGSGFGGGAPKFKAPSAWLTVEGSPKKIPLKVDAKTASDTEIHATLASLPKGLHGPATLHVLPKVKHGIESTTAVTIELPQIADLSAPNLSSGETLTLNGSYFGSKKRSVLFRATVGTKVKTWKLAVKTWTDGTITAVIPKKVVPKGSALLAGEVLVTNDAGESAALPFTVDA